SLSTLRRGDHSTRRKTRFRPAGQTLVGPIFVHRLDPFERFQLLLHPPSPGFSWRTRFSTGRGSCATLLLLLLVHDLLLDVHAALQLGREVGLAMLEERRSKPVDGGWHRARV